MGESNSNCGCCQKIWINWIRLCRLINDKIELLFEYEARFVTKYYKQVIAGCLFFMVVMAVGGWRFDPLMRNEELFIPQGSQAFIDLDEGHKYFGLKYRTEDILITFNNGNNVLSSNVALLKALELHQQIIKLKNYESSCFKVNGICLYVSILGLFNYNKTIIQNMSESTIQAKVNESYLDNTILLENGRPGSVNFPNILGAFKPYTASSSGKYESTAIRITYYAIYADTKESIYDTITSWEKEILNLCEDKVDEFNNAGLGLFYFTARTRDDAILESTVGDLPLFSVAFILMVLFCLLVFYRYDNPVTGHVVIGIAGIGVIMVGIICGFGLAMWCGVQFVAFTGILLFLILGIGMDNMFIIVDAMEEADPDVQGPERLVIAMKHIGGSITMTTMTDLVAFAVSTVSDFPAVHLFCVYAALSIFFAYFMLITLFVALLTADIHRVEAGKRDLFPCCRAKNYNPREVNPWEKNKSRVGKKFLKKWSKILMRTPMKIVVFFASMGLLAAGIYGTTETSQAFEWKKVAPDGSYFIKYADTLDANFPAGYGVSIILPPGVDYTLNTTHESLIKLDQIAIDNSRYEDYTINWLAGFYKWSGCNNITLCIDNGNLTGNNFYKNFENFRVANPMYAADLNIVNNTISSSRVIFFYENDNDGQNQANAMKTIRTDLEEKSDLKGIFAITIMFIYAEQYAKVLGDTTQNLIICACAIVVITLFYLIHPGITALVFLSFTSLIFELLGLMAAWDTSLDAIAMIVIIMAIGFSVDYTCHVAHAFMISKKPTADKRVMDAVTTMGSSVLNGGISTFLGMIITAASQAEGFRIFFRMVFGIVVLGLLHGLVFLPVLLSIFIQHDIRDDLKKFLDEHDKKDRERSQRRFSRMSEKQKRRQSISYRRSSAKTPVPYPGIEGNRKSSDAKSDKLDDVDQNWDAKLANLNQVNGIDNKGLE